MHKEEEVASNPTPTQQSETLPRPQPFDQGFWYRSAVSGLWHDAKSRESAGDIDAIRLDGIVYDRRAAVAGPRGDAEVICEWEDNGSDFWLASCGDAYKVYPNDINVTGMHFCCFCGGRIKPIEFDSSSDGPRQRAATSSPAPAESTRVAGEQGK